MKSYLVLNHYVFNKHYESLPNVFVLLLHIISHFFRQSTKFVQTFGFNFKVLLTRQMGTNIKAVLCAFFIKIYVDIRHYTQFECSKKAKIYHNIMVLFVVFGLQARNIFQIVL